MFNIGDQIRFKESGLSPDYAGYEGQSVTIFAVIGPGSGYDYQLAQEWYQGIQCYRVNLTGDPTGTYGPVPETDLEPIPQAPPPGPSPSEVAPGLPWGWIVGGCVAAIALISIAAKERKRG